MSNLVVAEASPFGARYRTHGNSCKVLKSAFVFNKKGE
jgi:hypothetical protein